MASGTTIRKGSTVSARLAGQLADLLVDARGTRTRADVARAAGVTTSTLAGLERGVANPTLAYLDQLGEHYGLEFDLVARPAGGVR